MKGYRKGIDETSHCSCVLKLAWEIQLFSGSWRIRQHNITLTFSFWFLLMLFLISWYYFFKQIPTNTKLIFRCLVYIFDIWVWQFRYFEKATKFLPSFHFLFDIILIRCAKLLWPSQNIWTLITHLSSRCGLVEGTNLDEHAVFELGFWNDIGNYFTIVFYLKPVPSGQTKVSCKLRIAGLFQYL